MGKSPQQKETRLGSESKVEIIEFISKKGKKMCKTVVTQTFQTEGVADVFTVESANYKSNEYLKLFNDKNL